MATSLVIFNAWKEESNFWACPFFCFESISDHMTISVVIWPCIFSGLFWIIFSTLKSLTPNNNKRLIYWITIYLVFCQIYWNDNNIYVFLFFKKKFNAVTLMSCDLRIFQNKKKGRPKSMLLLFSTLESFGKQMSNFHLYLYFSSMIITY